MPPNERPEYPYIEQLCLSDVPTDTSDMKCLIAGIPLETVAKTAFHLINRKWFQSIWVLQEFILARQVTFLYGNNAISFDAILTAVNWILRIDTSSRDQGQQGGISNLLSIPIIGILESTLIAQKKLASGTRLSVRDWLRTSSGRRAQNPRDFLFGGLSLIEPDSLRIDRVKLLAHKACEMPQNSVSGLLIPRGLWSVIEVDYKVDERELWVNLAACLLSDISPCNLDILSWAARIRDDVELGVSTTFSKPKSRVEMNINPLPSWVPILDGKLPANTMGTKNKVASAIEDARTGRSVFATGVTGKTPSPRISSGGTVLFLDAMALDVIETTIPRFFGASFLKGSFDDFLKSMEALVQLPREYPVGGGTSFDAIAFTLCSLISPFQHLLTDISTTGNSLEGESAAPASDFDPSAPLWLCEVIEREVRIWVDDLRQDIENKDRRDSSAKQENLDSLFLCYGQLSSKFYDLPWPCDIELGLAGKSEQISSRSTLEDRALALFSQIGEKCTRLIDEISSGPESNEGAAKQQAESDLSLVRCSQKTYPISPQAQDYARRLESSYGTIFRTKGGLSWSWTRMVKGGRSSDGYPWSRRTLLIAIS
ncbi:hypothetical protein PENSTE_c013G04330 [Penicillium steckii]|uniref:Heterokaryon incompatibility domain-containing protein n=1 Tax=Penicillium steckii TaxID=303698 RepID=A0A1V6T2G7_9EURO|nr:hypothetical protein PENSTE_c013G04330 [Penicillium steckii]